MKRRDNLVSFDLSKVKSINVRLEKARFSLIHIYEVNLVRSVGIKMNVWLLGLMRARGEFFLSFLSFLLFSFRPS